MKIKKLLILIVLYLFFNSCSKNKKKVNHKEKSLELQILEAYKEGNEITKRGRCIICSKKI